MRTNPETDEKVGEQGPCRRARREMEVMFRYNTGPQSRHWLHPTPPLHVCSRSFSDLPDSFAPKKLTLHEV